jgi:hypothetical protein
MKKLSMLGVIGGAAILTAVPLSLQWSQKDVVLSLASAEAQERPLTATSVAGHSRRAYRRAYRGATYAGAAGYQGRGTWPFDSASACACLRAVERQPERSGP